MKRQLNNYSYSTVGANVSSSTSALTSQNCDLPYLPTSKSKSVSFLLTESVDRSKSPKKYPLNHSAVACCPHTFYETTAFDNRSSSTFPRNVNSSQYYKRSNYEYETSHCDSHEIEASSPFRCPLNHDTQKHSSDRPNSRKSCTDIHSNPIFMENEDDPPFRHQPELSCAQGNDFSLHKSSYNLEEGHTINHHFRSPNSPLDTSRYPYDEENVPQNVYYIKSPTCHSFPCEYPCGCSCSSPSHFHHVVDCNNRHSVLSFDKLNHRDMQYFCDYHHQNKIRGARSPLADGATMIAADEIFYRTPSLSLDGQQDQTTHMFCVRILWPCIFLHRVKREISDSPPLPSPPPPPLSPPSSLQEPTFPTKSKSVERIDERRNAPIRYSVISYSSSSSIRDGRCSKIPKRTIFVFTLCIAAVFGLTTTNMFNINDYQERLHYVHSLLNDTILVDGHNDLAWNIRMYKHNLLNRYNYDQNLKQVHPWSTSNWSHTDLPRLKSGRVGAQMWSAYVHCESQFKDAVQMTLEQIDLIKRFTKMYTNMFNLCLSYNDIIETGKQKKVCSIITLEGGHSMANSLAVLRMYYDLGVRSMALTNKDCSTPWAEAAQMEGRMENRTFPVIGLNKFGLIVVHELNRLGMVIDLSGTSANTMKDALNASKAPVVFSHSNARTVCNVTQNVPDDILQLLIQNNGVVMVTFYPAYLNCENEANISNVVVHLNYLKEKVGVDHIGIGSGFDGIDRVPDNLNDTSFFPELFTALTAPGNPEWTSEELKKLAGLNILRVFQDAEKVRDAMKTVSPYEDVFKRYNNKTAGRRYDRDMRVCISHNHILN